MSLPPKNDDDTSSSSHSAAAAPKKTKRTVAPRGKKTAKVKTAEPELSFSESAPAPRETPPAPIFVPTPVTSSAAYGDSAPASSAPDYSSSSPSSPQESSHDGHGSSAESGPPQGADQSAGPAGGGWNQGGQGQGGQGNYGGPGQGGGGRGEWQGRDSWKRNKRKRGRNGGGPWQPNAPGGHGGGGFGGHGGGGPGPMHPPQPLPPASPQVFGDLPNPTRFTNLVDLDALATEISSGGGEALVLDDLYTLTLAELTAFARREGISIEGAPNRRTLQAQIFEAAAKAKRQILDRG